MKPPHQTKCAPETRRDAAGKPTTKTQKALTLLLICKVVIEWVGDNQAPDTAVLGDVA
jgi:hypothetical protein